MDKDSSGIAQHPNNKGNANQKDSEIPSHQNTR